ncbi:MAG: glycosyl hydrolase [Steroidobacteraceae bacterium]
MTPHARNRSALGWFALLATIAQCLSAQARAEELTHALGVYDGAGCTGTKRLPSFESWLGRKPQRVLDFIAWKEGRSGWNWVLGCWNAANIEALTISVPMLPSDGAATLAQGAAGKFDAMFADLALDLVKRGFANAIVRIGWEFNGDWYPWAAAKDPESWIAYWRRIVSIMRKAPGARFKFDWCPGTGWTAFEAQNAYPGDEYVDYIGMDVYDTSWDPKVVTPEQRWNEKMTARHGLKWHRDFAQAHGKPMSFPEWGIMTRTDGHGGGDNHRFIEHMAQWIAANNVAYHNYWDYKEKAYNSRLSDGSHPKSAEAFRNAFGRQGPSPALVTSEVRR